MIQEEVRIVYLIRRYLALHHVTYNYKSEAGRKMLPIDISFLIGTDWNLIKRSRVFDFMGARVSLPGIAINCYSTLVIKTTLPLL